MKIQHLIDNINIVLSEFALVSALSNDPIDRFTAAVEKKLFDTLRGKIRFNPEKQLIESVVTREVERKEARGVTAQVANLSFVEPACIYSSRLISYTGRNSKTCASGCVTSTKSC